MPRPIATETSLSVTVLSIAVFASHNIETNETPPTTVKAARVKNILIIPFSFFHLDKTAAAVHAFINKSLMIFHIFCCDSLDRVFHRSLIWKIS